MTSPPRYPRALFIAAFAIAARAAPMQPPTLERPRAAQIQARNRSVMHIIRGVGSAILAAGRASQQFHTRQVAFVRKALPKPVDPIVQALIDCPAIISAIGKAGTRDGLDVWVELKRDIGAGFVKLYWRGTLIRGERMARVWVDVGGVRKIAKGRGQICGASRTLDMERFTLAAKGARLSLAQAGFKVSDFFEIKRVKTESFTGAIATIGLRRR